MYEEYVSFRVLLRFFLSPEGAAVFLPASFFSEVVLPAGALPPVEGFFSAALGAIFSIGIGKWGVKREWEAKTRPVMNGVEKWDNFGMGWDGWGRMEEVAGGEETYTRWRAAVIAWRVPPQSKTMRSAKPSWAVDGRKSRASGCDFPNTYCESALLIGSVG